MTDKKFRQLFGNHKYKVLEPGHNGKLIIEIKGIVLVITRTSNSIIVHTVYGRIEDYKIKCPRPERAKECFEIYRWEKKLLNSRRKSIS